MPEYRRLLINGGTFFFTVVTYNRIPLFKNPKCRSILHNAWEDTQRRFPFKTIAICLLPDHLHCIWQLPEDDANYSVRWKEIKRLFTKQYLIEIGPGQQRNKSRQKRQEAAIWQRRFWEHAIKNDGDFERHLDYIHYNPIKHGYVEKASDWQWSSFHKFVHQGIYDNDWVGGNEGRIQGLDWE
ncbi:MAG: transposase [Chloroflexi bacterium HGW-Chloroflexi-2]|jgi:putative transposase|nr:MAG: transposase [Chloroflexi bacterium HGW-Chloroflexi-2]